MSTWKKAVTHPLFFLVLTVLFYNDHLLRVRWPSWWTGKLGDFAWLFLAPFVLVPLIRGIQNVLHQPLIETILPSILLTGIYFTLFKTWLPFYEANVVIGRMVFGEAFHLVFDPTDLIALPALFGTWLLWERVRRQHAGGRLPVWPSLGFFTLLTIANMPAPNWGIDCLASSEDRILAGTSYYEKFQSFDGGLHWEPADEKQPDCETADLPQIVPHPVFPEVRYRFDQTESVDVSYDGGETWNREFSNEGQSQAETAYIRKILEVSVVDSPGPYAVLFDERSDNTVFAMGLQGILVQSAGGVWQWVAAGSYSYEQLGSFRSAIRLVSGELYQGLLWAMLVFVTLSLGHDRTRARVVFTSIAWILGIGVSVFFPRALVVGYEWVIAVPGYLAVWLLAFFLVGRSFLHSDALIRDPTFRRSLISALISAVLFIGCIFLWAFKIIPNYHVAWLIAMVTIVVVVAVHIRSLKAMKGYVQEASEERS